jgi:hypothetical protein
MPDILIRPAAGALRFDATSDRGRRLLAEFYGRSLERIDLSPWLAPTVRANLEALGARTKSRPDPTTPDGA